MINPMPEHLRSVAARLTADLNNGRKTPEQVIKACVAAVHRWADALERWRLSVLKRGREREAELKKEYDEEKKSPKPDNNRTRFLMEAMDNVGNALGLAANVKGDITLLRSLPNKWPTLDPSYAGRVLTIVWDLPSNPNLGGIISRLHNADRNLFMDQEGEKRTKLRHRHSEESGAAPTKAFTSHELAKHMQDYLLKFFPTASRKHPERMRKIAYKQAKLVPGAIAQNIGYGRLLYDERLMTSGKLSSFGIPAVDIVGPWRSTPDGPVQPKQWLKERGSSIGAEGNVYEWMQNARLDQHDHVLAEALKRAQERKNAPLTFEEGRRISNSLDEERRRKEDTEKLAPIETWLTWSQQQREKSKKRVVDVFDESRLPAGWRFLKPGDGPELIKRAKRDGLCVVDVVAAAGQEVENGDKPDLYALVVNDDPKRRTVVGLQEDGRVHDHHQATGNNNELDLEAFSYFSEKWYYRKGKAHATV